MFLLNLQPSHPNISSSSMQIVEDPPADTRPFKRHKRKVAETVPTALERVKYVPAPVHVQEPENVPEKSKERSKSPKKPNKMPKLESKTETKEKKSKEPLKPVKDSKNNSENTLSTVTAKLLQKMSDDKRFNEFNEDDSVAEVSRPPSHAPSEPVSEGEEKKKVVTVSVPIAPVNVIKPKTKRRDYRIISSKARLPCIDEEEVVKAEISLYEWYGDNPENKAVDQYEVLELEYPQGTEKYPLLNPTKAGEADPVNDIYYTTQMLVLEVFPLLKELPEYQEYVEACKKGEDKIPIPDFGNKVNGTLRQILKACHKTNREGLIEAVKEFNQKMQVFRNLPNPQENFFAQLEVNLPMTVPYNIVTHILEQAYGRTVAPYSELLNQYRGFSNNVYGEVRANLVQEFIKNARIRRGSVFLDMGSGIGSVVLQVAAQCLADSTGVEIMEIPAKLGRKYQHEFMSRLHYYGLPCGKLRLVHSDFLTSKEVDDIIPRADVVFVNNYAFAPDLNQKILAKFLDLKEGARVISLKSFVSHDRKINKRNEGALENIFKVKEYLFGEEMVSWTHEGGRYFIHEVDRRHLHVPPKR